MFTSFNLKSCIWFDVMDPTTTSNFLETSERVRHRPWQWLDKHWGITHETYMAVWTACSAQERPRKARQVKGKVKSMPNIFLCIKMIVLNEFVSAGQAVNSWYYCDDLPRLCKNERRLRPKFWRQNKWLLNHYNTPSHTSFFLPGEFEPKTTWLLSPTHSNFLCFFDWR
jgi:hypothetical protein